MMKCMLCGTENRAEAKNCKGCGALLAPKDSGIPARRVAPTVLENNIGTGSASSKTRIVTPEEMEHATQSQNQGQGAHQFEAKKTRYVAPDAGSTSSPVSSSGQGPLAGFLVTFSWDAGGLSFAIREGKTTVGSDPSCDAVVRNDRAMSGKHFAIMVRQGAVRVRDLESTNATHVDGQEVWSESLPALHGSMIKAGDTVFTLVLIPKASAVSQGADTSGQVKDE